MRCTDTNMFSFPFLMIKLTHTHIHGCGGSAKTLPRPTYSPTSTPDRIHVSYSYMGNAVHGNTFLKIPRASAFSLSPSWHFPHQRHTEQRMQNIHYSGRGFQVSRLWRLERPLMGLSLYMWESPGASGLLSSRNTYASYGIHADIDIGISLFDVLNLASPLPIMVPSHTPFSKLSGVLVLVMFWSCLHDTILTVRVQGSQAVNLVSPPYYVIRPGVCASVVPTFLPRIEDRSRPRAVTMCRSCMVPFSQHCRVTSGGSR